MKLNTLQKALKIIGIQQNKSLTQIAKELGFTPREFNQIIRRESDPTHTQIKEYIVKHLDTEYVNPKISAIINDKTYKEYAKELGMTYTQFIQKI